MRALWKALLWNTGDCQHDNMNSDMFMKWVKKKLVPTFERMHAGSKEDDPCRQQYTDASNAIYIPICEGISGNIGSLVVYNNHTPNKEGLPVDMLLVDLTNLPDDDDDNRDE